MTPPAGRRNVRFVWSGDTAGQGWGINPDFGGMRIYETMRQVEPDFFIHSGDTIYADGPIYAEARTQDGRTWLGPDGKPWRNVTIPEKEKVAETLREFRMNYAYNLMDENLRRVQRGGADVRAVGRPRGHQQLVLGSCARTRTSAIPGGQRRGAGGAGACGAFHDYMPTRLHPLEQDRLYTSFALRARRSRCSGIDLRSYRGAEQRRPADRAQRRRRGSSAREQLPLADAGAEGARTPPGR